MAFDIQKALADGHSPAEIADYLGKKVGFDTAKARADGHPDADILRHVMQKQADIQTLHEGRLASAESALAAEKAKASPMSLGDKALTAADLAAAGLSNLVVGGVAGGAAGLGARILGKDPAAAKKWVDENMVYHPQTEAGQGIAGDVQQAAGAALAPVGRAISSADAAVGKYAGTGTQNVLRQTLGTAGDIASVLPGVGAAAKAVDLARTAKAAEATKLATTPLEIAQASGHKMLPSTVESGTAVGEKPNLLTRTLETVGGTKELERSFIRQDLTNSNRLLAEGVGLPSNTILTDAAIAKAKVAPAKVYNEIRKSVPPAPLSTETQVAIQAAGRGTASKLELPANVQAIKDKLANGEATWTSNEVLDTMSDLRNKATKDMMSNDSDVVARGNAQMDIAHALEGHLETQLNNNRFLVTPEQFRGARTTFAKIYSLDNARTGFDVDPQAIAKFGRETRLASGKSANTGEFAIVEQNATHSPNESTSTVPSLREMSAASPGGAIGRAVLAPPRALARALLNKTRGITTGVPARENPALANFFQQDRPPNRPALTLTPPEGRAFEPNQPSMLRSGETVPLAESSQHMRPDVPLQPPPGQAFNPAQYDLLTMLAEKLRESN
jgi:hypothetical protein